jgi:hypothetical protein
MKLSLEVAKEMYISGIESIKSFALENYPELGKKELPKSWEELDSIDGAYVTRNSITQNVKGFSSCDTKNQNVFKTEDQANAAIALAKLSQLKAVYNEGWVADWEDDNHLKTCIVPFLNYIEIRSSYEYPKFLSFKDHKTAQEFLTNFKEDIIKAFPLMS